MAAALTPRPRWWWSVATARLLAAAVCAVALVSRFQWGLGSVTFEPANFFAYLTIQSNIAYAVTAGVAGVIALRGHSTGPLFDALRAAVLTCTITAGIVFAVILQQSTARGIRVDVPWSDVVLHFVLPVVATADWMLAPRSRTRPTVIAFVLGYVSIWGAITIVRGAVTGWYPYYFLDPVQTESPAEFVLISGLAVVVFAVIGLAVTLIHPSLARYPAERMAREPAEPRRARPRHPAR